MMKKNVTIIFTFFAFVLMTNLLTINVFAAPKPSLILNGRQKLEDKVNAEEARVAELNVRLDPSLGINRTLRKKSRGNDVKLLQKFLKVYGVYPESFITGYFGSLTEAAVKRFQEKEAIDSVGIVGPKTRGRMRALSREKVKVQKEKTALAGAVIVDAALAASITEIGSPTAELTRFASTTENIYAVLFLKNAKQDSEISYIRYHNDAYVDSEVSHPSRDGLTYFHFQWSLKPGKVRTVGAYALVFFVNGQKSKTINYSIY